MKVFNEDDILNIEFRRQIIEEITGSENVARKREAKKRYEIYKDKTKKYVIENLKNEGLKETTVAQMENRAANVSIVKKIVNKRARSYVGGVQRSTDDELATGKVNAMENMLDYDSKMKKSDRFRDLYKNCAIYFVPEIDDLSSKFRLKMMILSPWQYDVIEDARDREKAKVVVLSDYSETASYSSASRSESDAKLHDGPIASSSDGIDNAIADHPNDAGADGNITFTWWSDTHHFVTDEAGQVIPDRSPEMQDNPIGILPFTMISEDQDGEFWAQGGDDLIEGAVLINTIITDMFFISKMQGYGQIVVSGKNLPTFMETGPNNAIFLEYDPGNEDPKPDFEIVSSSPPIDQWLRSIEQYVALLLTTNNLSTSTIKMSLDGQTFPSGIAMIIDMAEVSAEMQDNREQFEDSERRNWFIIALWTSLLIEKNQADKKLLAIGSMDPDVDVNVKFTEQKATVSEAEKLDNLDKRKNLGINEMVDLIKIDNPDMDDKQALEKLTRIAAERLQRMNISFVKEQNADDPKDEDKDDSNQE